VSELLVSAAANGRVASFDVFDTVLTRLTGGPRQVFAATGRRLRRDGVLDLDPEAYAAAREQAISILTSDIARHPPLAAIVAELVARLALPGVLAEQLIAAELAVESEVCRAVPGAPERVERARQVTGRGVLFVSDTPLPSGFLQGLLIREGLFRDGDRLVTSSEAGASKQHGGLFDVICADLGLEPSALDHVGDDRWADVAHPRLHGWRAEQDTRALLHPRELRLDAAAASTDGIGGRLAGAARLGRLAAVESGGDAGIASVATSVAMPLLVGFGTWVLQQARLLGLDRLYFLARDGEVFLEVTRRLAEQAGDPIECRYLYGSRRAWQLASAGATGPDGELWIPDDLAAEDLTAREVLFLVGLSPEDAVAVSAAEDLAPRRADQVLGAAGWSRLRPALAAGPLAAEIARRADGRRELLIRYLVQEGVTADGRVGFVDIGWTGRAARSLEDVLAEAGMPTAAAHLFLGLRSTAPERMGADLFARSHGWLLDEARGRGVPPGAGPDVVRDPVRLFETFAMGSEGHTTGFAADGDLVAPVLAAEQNPNAGGWDFAGYRSALLSAVEFALDGPPLDPRVDLRPLVWRQVLDLWQAPTRQEARAWGAQPYGDDYANATGHPIATALTARRVLTRLGVGDPAWREPTYWVAGSIAVSGAPWRSVLPFVERLQQSTCRLSRIPSRLRSEWVLRRPTRS
jgi:FMN phosphatase YigB (HAD superfamily)